MSYHVIIIGGGPSGLMASIAAALHGEKVLLVDKGNKLGRKLGISGGGRCNVTNAKEIDELITFIPGNGRFLYSAFSTFNNQDIMRFFEGLGIALKEEDRGRMFPVSDKAKTVVDALIAKVRSLGVEIRINAPVKEVSYEEGQVKGIILQTGEPLLSKTVILASGGKSVPQTGSTGDGYAWAEAAGHTITELYPTEVPITSNEPFILSKELQGLSLRDITLTVWSPKGKPIKTHEGDMLFTHFGISGPAVLRCSQYVVKARKKFNVETIQMTLNLFPDKTKDEIYEETWRLAKEDSKKSVKNVLKSYLPERMLPVLMQKAGLTAGITFDHIPKQSWTNLAELLHAFPIEVSGTLSIEEAFVTGGGVSLKEVEPKTMQSKIMGGLFFCGEILDIHGYTGGYNITAAFSTGYNAGKSASEEAKTMGSSSHFSNQ